MVLSLFGDCHGKTCKKNEMTHVICGIVVLNRFDEFHAEYLEKFREFLSLVASWYWAFLVIFMGKLAKKWDDACYLWHRGTEPFWWISWELSWKLWMKSVICGIMVPSRFGVFHCKYRRKTRWRVLFVAAWYRAVFVRFLERFMREREDLRVLFVASLYWAAFVDCMENTLEKIRKRLSLVASWYWDILAKFMGNDMKNLRSGMSFVASWYRAVVVILMGKRVKNAD